MNEEPLFRQPNDHEAELLRDLQEWHDLSLQPAWRKLKQHMQQLMDESRSALEGCISSDPQLSHTLRLRHQQRSAVIKEIVTIVEDANADRAALLDSLRQPTEDDDNQSQIASAGG